MKNVKVNYTDKDGKRTSTTINGNICWQYFKKSDIYKNSEGGKDSIRQEIQRFVNTIKVSNYHIDKDLIESMLLIHVICDEYQRGTTDGIKARREYEQEQKRKGLIL